MEAWRAKRPRSDSPTSSDDDSAPVVRQYAQVGKSRAPKAVRNTGGAELAPTGHDSGFPHYLYNITGGGAYSNDGPNERAREVDAHQVNYAAGIAAGAANLNYAGGRRAQTLVGGPYNGTFGPDDRGQPMGSEYIPRGPLTAGGVYGRALEPDPATGRRPLQLAQTHEAYRQRFGQEPEGVQQFNLQHIDRMLANYDAQRARMMGPMNEAGGGSYTASVSYTHLTLPTKVSV